jgi:hypothetical protein
MRRRQNYSRGARISRFRNPQSKLWKSTHCREWRSRKGKALANYRNFLEIAERLVIPENSIQPTSLVSTPLRGDFCNTICQKATSAKR